MATQESLDKDGGKMPELSVKRTGLYFVAACVGIAVAWAAVKHKDVTPSVPEASYSISRQIRYGFTLQNTTNRLLKGAELWTYAPVKQTSTQRCVRLETSHPYELIVDDLGNQILHFAFEDLPPYANRVITIKADLLLAQVPNPVKTKDLDLYLRSEKYIESEDASLKALAQTLRTQASAETAENIYQWVADHVTYAGFSGKDLGALYALNNRKGDCTEYMYLFVALCRANDIPARCMGGYICQKNEILKSNGYHNWAEIYDSGTWQPVDPQNGVFKEKASQFIAMRIIDETKGNTMGDKHRFRFKGDGLKVQMNS